MLDVGLLGLFEPSVNPSRDEFEVIDDEVCAAHDKFDPVRSDEELIPGLLGRGPWRRLKGGVTMDSGCAIDTMPKVKIPGVKMEPTPPNRKGRSIAAANGTVIKEHGVQRLNFTTKDGTVQAWKMIVADVKKALKSIKYPTVTTLFNKKQL